MLSLQIAIIALMITRIAASAGNRLGPLDERDARKNHLSAVPLTGGIAIFLTVLVGTPVLGIAPLTYPMLGIACLVFLVGVFDDFQHIRPAVRLLIELCSGVLLATVGGIAIVNVGDLLTLGNIPLLILGVPLTALAVAGLSNAFNMIDGIDGLAASMLALPMLALFALALGANHPMANSLLLILIPLGVFLLFNLGPNNRILPKMFLGDGGSVTLGFMVTASLVYFSQGENAVIRPVTALWLVTVPLMDMLATMLRRARQGQKIMAADRSHLHHSLMDMGFSSQQTLLLLVCYATACALLGKVLEGVPESLSLAVYILLFVAHCLFVLKTDAIGRRVRRRLLKPGARSDEYCEPN
ncbi:MAG: undecaprenyl/decaprenyl-phosphate alpha-N-acetylglucosaminyl 1-phosphate transferase [Pseudomonadales bacterium]|nr:undecaprenyl/decaprenyl-phosphate alpha-N-acetylglucosaminyl 1-phosphate transferase [Pseudomonadales bacterium]